MSRAVNDEALDILFREARTQNLWLDKPVSKALLMAIYDLMRWGPTSANISPARLLILMSKAAKERLIPHLLPGNQAKTMAAPATVIIAYDLKFADNVPRLFPHAPEAKDWFSDPRFAEVSAFRNGTLQGAYFLIAARALGLDCGPMSGFDNDGVDREFFPGGTVKSNFLCSVGYGDKAGVFPRNPRLSFDEACTFL